ncbi:MAG: hypothetical protein QOJ98_819 [Acidobacteriota bacterium]|jgi:predicted small secreted protein|nr:hypothetical protein [Acidobacteriota bacterium]
MKRAAVLVLLSVALASCRTARPTGAPLSPLTAASIEEAAMQLREQRATFTNVRSLMRVRATTNGKTQSFRAQLAVHDAQRMELVAYTPVGTTALTLKANGNQVTTDPEVAPESFAFLRAAGLTPAETAMLLLGMPPRDDVPVTLAPTGIASASAGELTVTFDPPSFPAKRVIITRGADRVEIEHLEVVR